MTLDEEGMSNNNNLKLRLCGFQTCRMCHCNLESVMRLPLLTVFQIYWMFFSLFWCYTTSFVSVHFLIWCLILVLKTNRWFQDLSSLLAGLTHILSIIVCYILWTFIVPLGVFVVTCSVLSSPCFTQIMGQFPPFARHRHRDLPPLVHSSNVQNSQG